MKIRAAAVGVWVIISVSASASTNTGMVADITGANASFVYLSIKSPASPYASCAQQNRYVIDVSSVGGRSMLAIALAAKSAGQSIVVIGAGTCGLRPNDAEDINNVGTSW